MGAAVAIPAQLTAPRRVWVMGARGMLGQAVVHALARGGHHVHATGSEVDVGCKDAIHAHARQALADTWINCAAMTQVDACEDGHEGAARNEAVNARAPGIVAAEARRQGARILHVSTDYVFAGDATLPYVEGDACAPRSAYGRAKWQGEQNFWQALGAQAAAVGYVVRTAWLFGPWGGNFVATMLRLMRAQQQLHVVDDQRGRPTYTLDLAEGILALLGLSAAQNLPAAGGTYHFANAGETSWHGFACEILQQARVHAPNLCCRAVQPTTSAAYVRPAPRPQYSVLSTAKWSRATLRQPRPYVNALADYLVHPSAAFWQ